MVEPLLQRARLDEQLDGAAHARPVGDARDGQLAARAAALVVVAVVAVDAGRVGRRHKQRDAQPPRAAAAAAAARRAQPHLERAAREGLGRAVALQHVECAVLLLCHLHDLAREVLHDRLTGC